MSVIEKYHYDDGEDRLTIQRVENVSSVIEQNKRQFDVDNKRHKSETMNHYARIPLSAIEQYCREKGIKYEEMMGDQNLFKKFLNDPDNKVWRTRSGKI